MYNMCTCVWTVLLLILQLWHYDSNWLFNQVDLHSCDWICMVVVEGGTIWARSTGVETPADMQCLHVHVCYSMPTFPELLCLIPQLLCRSGFILTSDPQWLLPILVSMQCWVCYRLSWFSVVPSMAAIVASLTLHNINGTFNDILCSPMAFFNTTSIWWILNSFSKDIYIIDEVMPCSLCSFNWTFLGVVSTVTTAVNHHDSHTHLQCCRHATGCVLLAGGSGYVLWSCSHSTGI